MHRRGRRRRGTPFGEVHAKSVLGYVLAEQQALLDYGAQASDTLPDLRGVPSDVDLLGDARRRAQG